MFGAMAESQYLSVIRIWAALAWSDGVIADAEAAAMRRLIESADLTDEERASALGMMQSRVDLDTATLASLSEEARQGIYRAAARLAAVDLEVAEEELHFLERLQEGLGIDDDTAEDLEKGIPALAK